MAANPVLIANTTAPAIGVFQKMSDQYTDFWRKTSASSAGSRLLFSAAVAVVCAIVLFIMRPPMIRDKSDVPYRSGNVSFLKISIWALVAFILSFALMNFC